MLPTKSTKAQLQAANEILVEAAGQLMNMVADLQEENERLKQSHKNLGSPSRRI